MAHHHEVTGERIVVEVAHAQLCDDRQVSGQHLAGGLPVGQRQIDVTLVPALVDGVELLDRRIVVPVLELTHLDLVDAVDFISAHPEFVGDLACGLRSPHCHRVRDEAGLVRESAGKAAGLIPAEIGQSRAGRSGVEPTLDVSVRLSMPDQHQPSTH